MLKSCSSFEYLLEALDHGLEKRRGLGGAFLDHSAELVGVLPRPTEVRDVFAKAGMLPLGPRQVHAAQM
jgi:hypothetical protein